MLDAAFAVHNELGPGLLESTYKACLVYELEKRGMSVQAEVPVRVMYDGKNLVEVGYRIDLLIEGQLIIEIKACEGIALAHRAQLLTYLKHSRRRLGLILNFYCPHLKDGIVRMVNNL